MKRNEGCIRKTIYYHLKKSGEISNSIFLSFKKVNQPVIGFVEDIKRAILKNKIKKNKFRRRGYYLDVVLGDEPRSVR